MIKPSCMREVKNKRKKERRILDVVDFRSLPRKHGMEFAV